MTTLATLRAVVRRNLHDEDAANYLWTDDEIDRHLAAALAEYSLAAPLEEKTDLATTPGSGDISLATLTDLITVSAVEFPKGNLPPSYNRFGVWEGVLSLLSGAVGDGSNAAVYYGKRHTLSVSASTIPAQHEDLVAQGAGGYAALEMALFTANRVNTGGAEAAVRYTALGTAALVQFRRELRRLGKNGRVRTATLHI
jgi:hypothetical protein